MRQVIKSTTPVEPTTYNRVETTSLYIAKDKMASSGNSTVKNRISSSGNSTMKHRISSSDLAWNLADANRKSVGYSLKKGREG
jgi:hypothetical protein